jgi:hypothetical protein
MLQKSATIPDQSGVTGGGVTDFDIQGVSFYPTSTNLITTMQANLTALANTSRANFLADPSKPMKKIMVLENNYPWTTSSVGSSMWPKTPAGQKAELEAVRDLVLGLPHGAGLGVLYWYPEAVRVKNYGIYNNGATALFDSNLVDSFDNTHHALPALEAFEITLVPGDYDYDRVVDAQDLAVWSGSFGALGAGLDADGDGDGDVDGADFLTWQRAASWPGAAAAAEAIVPEPSSLSAVLLAAWGAGAARRRAKRHGGGVTMAAGA